MPFLHAVSSYCLKKFLPTGCQGASGPLDRRLSSPCPTASIRNKANFPFHQPGLFIGFGAVSSRTSTHSFGNRISVNYYIRVRVGVNVAVSIRVSICVSIIIRVSICISVSFGFRVKVSVSVGFGV